MPTQLRPRRCYAIKDSANPIRNGPESQDSRRLLRRLDPPERGVGWVEVDDKEEAQVARVSDPRARQERQPSRSRVSCILSITFAHLRCAIVTSGRAGGDRTHSLRFRKPAPAFQFGFRAMFGTPVTSRTSPSGFVIPSPLSRGEGVIVAPAAGLEPANPMRAPG